MDLQAHHIDLDFYQEFYKPGAYLKTHAEHMANGTQMTPSHGTPTEPLLDGSEMAHDVNLG